MKPVWSRRAVRDLEALRGHIAKDSEEIAPGVARRILAAIDLVQTQPDMGRAGRVLGTRELVIAPYVIPYRLRQGRLELVAIFHGRQRWPAKFGAE